jgi:Flp pilus assembly pilin Flp
MLKKLSQAGRRILRDENGQTMLEYIVIVVFVVIAAIVAFEIISGIVTRGSRRVSASTGI